MVLGALHCGPRPSGPTKEPEPAEATLAEGTAAALVSAAAAPGELAGLKFVEPTPAQGPAVPPLAPGYDSFYAGAKPPETMSVPEAPETGRALELHNRLEYYARPPSEVALFYPGALHEFLKVGYTVAAHRVGRQSRSASLVHPSGPRVLLQVFAYEREVIIEAFGVPRPAAPLAMPGPCVAVPTVGFEMPWYPTEGAPRTRHETRFDLDLDGDGVFDAAVPIPGDSGCLDEVLHALYVTRGACGHYVGTVGPWLPVGRQLMATPLGTTGLKDIPVFTSRTVGAGEAARKVQAEIKFAFDGQVYREVDRKVVEESCTDCKAQECLGTFALPPEPPAGG